MLKIRRSVDRLIFNMGIFIREKTVFILRFLRFLVPEAQSEGQSHQELDQGPKYPHEVSECLCELLSGRNHGVLARTQLISQVGDFSHELCCNKKYLYYQLLCCCLMLPNVATYGVSATKCNLQHTATCGVSTTECNHKYAATWECLLASVAINILLHVGVSAGECNHYAATWSICWRV